MADSIDCPWCRVAFAVQAHVGGFNHKKPQDTEPPVREWLAQTFVCPKCFNPIMRCTRYLKDGNSDVAIIYPRAHGRNPAPPEVPKKYREDHDEACSVLPISPQSSAALSRRMLQAILLDPTGVGVQKQKSDNLDKQIDRAKGKLPEYIWDDLHALRQLGNFAAHEQIDDQHGIVVKVDADEAEFALDVVDELFQHCFVARTKSKASRGKIAKKLKQVGNTHGAKKADP